MIFKGGRFFWDTLVGPAGLVLAFTYSKIRDVAGENELPAKFQCLQDVNYKVERMPLCCQLTNVR